MRTGEMKRTPLTRRRRACSVDGCGSPRVGWGWCSTHYARWKRTGSVELTPVAAVDRCSVEGCDRVPRSRISPHCEKHYYRLRRTGTTDDPQRISGTCSVGDCTMDSYAWDGLCRKHHLRSKNRSDVNFEYRGKANHCWTGDDVTYRGIHQRVRKQKGSAAAYPCIDCGGQARHWSYNHLHPEQRTDPITGAPYAADEANYEPRCAGCHKKFDLKHGAGKNLRKYPKESVDTALIDLRSGASNIRVAAKRMGCTPDHLSRRAWERTKEEVFARDGHACIRCGATERLDAHHRIPRGMGGSRPTISFGLANIITVCREHHDDIESRRTWATVHGWLVSRGTDPELVPLLTRHGWVRLTNEGGTDT